MNILDFAQFCVSCIDVQIVNDKTMDEYNRRQDRVLELKDVVDDWRKYSEFEKCEVDYITAKDTVRIKLIRNSIFQVIELPYCDLEKTIKSYKDKIRYEKTLRE